MLIKLLVLLLSETTNSTWYFKQVFVPLNINSFHCKHEWFCLEMLRLEDGEDVPCRPVQKL